MYIRTSASRLKKKTCTVLCVVMCVDVLEHDYARHLKHDQLCHESWLIATSERIDFYFPRNHFLSVRALIHVQIL